jgi:glycosyltransferase involved in cell wall biosynthesis
MMGFWSVSLAMLATIAICTFNRADSLRRTLESLVAMTVPKDLLWEVVVVNNNCTDDTDEVVKEFKDRLPVRCEFEARPGLSNARNRAVGVAQGTYILWTDDDVIVDVGWLQGYLDAFRRWPEAAVFGGRIVPRYEDPVSKWVKENEAMLGGVFALRDFGDKAQPLSVAEKRILPYGANFATRAVEQRRFRYDPNLGVAPNQRRTGEEIDVVTRILEAGAKGYWIPRATVNHCIGRERQTTRSIADHYARWGETQAYCATAAIGLGFAPTGSTATPPARLWFGVPRGLWRRLVSRWFRYHYYRLLSPSQIWVMHLQNYAETKGEFQYWWQRKCLE